MIVVNKGLEAAMRNKLSHMLTDKEKTTYKGRKDHEVAAFVAGSLVIGIAKKFKAHETDLSTDIDWTNNRIRLTADVPSVDEGIEIVIGAYVPYKYTV